MRKAIMAGVAVAALAVAGSASAATIILQSTFESPVITSPSYTIVGSADGWTAGAGTAGIEIQNNVAGAPAPDGGAQFVELDSNSNSSMYYTLAAGGSYTMSFLYSPRPNVGSASNGITLYVGGTELNPPGEITGVGGSSTNWALHTVNFTANAGDQVMFWATGTSDSLGGYLDNITISAVPEPATWAMMIAGFGMAGAAIRRRHAIKAIAA